MPIIELGGIIETHERNGFSIELCFASYDYIDDLCNIVNWAYRGKPSATNSKETYSGWIGEEHLLSGTRILPYQLKEYIDKMEQNKENPDTIIIAAKFINTDIPHKKEIVGCIKVELYDSNLQPLEEKQDGTAIEIGLHAVDPDYQSKGIGTLVYNAAIRVSKEHMNAKRVYLHIIASKTNQIDLKIRQGFINTGRYVPFSDIDQFVPKVNRELLKFAVLTKTIE
ncbi:unnamed protein product [Didymodactylos carnosus]|uniref:N-acetyltransferase domain-containing protein n=1 Tax=Didymodactylos carnosus TaxID=1234261 RepID=A0A814JCZ5_9BILA|nr:unnamed protein product [Didymodactylos carnosus]CAF1035154.1 unnamed protein product [Didymodactylos carnosus]CAF3639873.1 unnamed protein product [Didymodactylos carnosus]CAF3805803.1 unnamed protein product [Didymodactylos carnosus]